ncbi:MAG: creatininase family protein, partial [Actinomycetota bacterium]|nr:creatininase family protein [Actinomycetota bacterium]
MAAEGAILMLPVGATEQHGPHLPVWTDSLVAEHLARAAAHTVAPELGVVVAPTLSFGSSDHHL